MSTTTARVALRAPAVFVAIVLLAAASACGDQASGAQLVESAVPRAAAGASDAAEGARVARRVGVALYPHLLDQVGDGNLAYSPVSITVALGMTRAGAEGASAQELDALLGSGDPAALHRGLNGLDQLLTTRAGQRKDSKDRDAEITLEAANSLWAQQDVEWEDPFLDLLKREYGVGMHVVDYIDDTEGARNQVNRWVADRTRDEIPELIPEDVFKETTRLTLVNALYLAAPWDEEFDEAPAAPFTTAAGRQVQAPMMKNTIVGHQQGDGWRAVTIPYAGGELAMTVIVPDADGLAAFEASLTEELLDQILTTPDTDAVDLTMPRFDLDSSAPLRPALEAAGVRAPFVTDHDFAPMTDDPAAAPLLLADVVHAATVTVDEKGTVAAAATASVFDKVGAMIAEPLVVDRPFLFVIHDVETAAPLFVGRVTDPTAR